VARHELDLDAAAVDRVPVFRDDDLELLRLLMSGAVIASRGEKPSVVGDRETLHQVRNELLGWQTTERLVLSRDIEMEAAVRTGDLSLRFEPAKRSASSCRRDSECTRDLVGGEQVSPNTGPVPDEFANGVSTLRIHATKVTLSGTFVE